MERSRALTVDELHHLPARIDAFIDESWSSIVEDMRSLIAIPSVAGNRLAQPDAPFGPQAREALDEAAAICRRLGLHVQEHDGRFATATVPGSEGAEKRVAVMSHVDVVPAGDGWTTDPFTLTKREGYLIGRGVLDDKGPAALSFYAALFFLQNDVQLPYELQLVIGANEEDGMEDVEAYLAACGEPDFLFTPDAEFPVCCGEKGRLVGTFSSERFLGDDARIVGFEGGQATNAIPGSAFAVVRVPLASLGSSETPYEVAQALCAGLKLPHDVTASVADISDEGEAGPVALIRLEAAGVGGHASRPQGTRNAIGMLVEALLDNEALASPKERTFLRLLAKIHESPDARALGIDATDALFTPLTCIGGTIACEDGRLIQSIDVRYPPSTDHERIDQRLSEVAREYDAAFNLDLGLLMVPYQIDPEKPEVQALMDAYAQVSGVEPEPLTLGGGTYARHFANAVSFGPIEENDPAPSWVGPMHGADEGFSVAALKRALKTYILALANLAKTSW